MTTKKFFMIFAMFSMAASAQQWGGVVINDRPAVTYTGHGYMPTAATIPYAPNYQYGYGSGYMPVYTYGYNGYYGRGWANSPWLYANIGTAAALTVAAIATRPKASNPEAELVKQQGKAAGKHADAGKERVKSLVWCDKHLVGHPDGKERLAACMAAMNMTNPGTAEASDHINDEVIVSNLVKK